MFKLIATGALLLLFAPVVLADCGDDPTNLLFDQNCDFDGDITGWEQTVGNAFDHNDMVSYPPSSVPGSGSFQVDAFDVTAFARARVRAPCLDVDGTPTLAYGGYFRTLSGANSTCSITFIAFDGAGCTGSSTQILTPTTLALPTLGAFDQSHAEVTFPADRESAQLSLTCEATADFTILIDNVYLGEGLTVPVELQSFTVD